MYETKKLTYLEKKGRKRGVLKKRKGPLSLPLIRYWRKEHRRKKNVAGGEEGTEKENF